MENSPPLSTCHSLSTTAEKQQTNMNTTGKQARRTSGMNRHQIKRATRVKRIEHMKDYNPNVGTNARHKTSK